MNAVRILTSTALLAASLAVFSCASINEFSGLPAPRPMEATQPTTEQQTRIDEGRSAAAAGDYNVALGIFQEILAENPTITVAYLEVGKIHMITEDYEKAEPAYARAARLEPRNFDAQYGHGLALQMLNRFVDAIKAYHRALTIEPDSYEANFNIATTYLQMDEPHRAVTFAQRAVEIEPANGSARANLGAVYEKLERNAEAVDAYIAALELIGNEPPLMMNLINVLAAELRYREAINAAENLNRISPSANAYERVGWCSFKLRDYQQSIDSYRNAVELDPELWPAWNGIGVNALNNWLLSKKRDGEARLEARNALRRSLQINPDQQKVVQLLSNYSL